MLTSTKQLLSYTLLQAENMAGNNSMQLGYLDFKGYFAVPGRCAAGAWEAFA